MFGVPITGSFAALLVASLLFSVCSTGMGLLASALTRSQIAAMFFTMLGTIIPAGAVRGLINPVSSLEGSGRWIGEVYPATYMFAISRGVFSKALDFADVQAALWPLLVAIPVILGGAIACCGSRSVEMMRHLINVYRLGVKELWSLWRDPMMLVLIVYTFTAAIYVAGTAMPETLNRAPIAVVDEDDSALSARIVSAFYPPQFTRHNASPRPRWTRPGCWALHLCVGHSAGLSARRAGGSQPQVQLNIDATRMSQAFAGNGAIQQIVLGEVNEFVQRYRAESRLPVEMAVRMRFNPALEPSWFGSLMEVVNNITMLSIILTGAALIREREHGTVEHLLVMPVTPLKSCWPRSGPWRAWSCWRPVSR